MISGCPHDIIPSNSPMNTHIQRPFSNTIQEYTNSARIAVRCLSTTTSALCLPLTLTVNMVYIWISPYPIGIWQPVNFSFVSEYNIE